MTNVWTALADGLGRFLARLIARVEQHQLVESIDDTVKILSDRDQVLSDRIGALESRDWEARLVFTIDRVNELERAVWPKDPEGEGPN